MCVRQKEENENIFLEGISFMLTDKIKIFYCLKLPVMHDELIYWPLYRIFLTMQNCIEDISKKELVTEWIIELFKIMHIQGEKMM